MAKMWFRPKKWGWGWTPISIEGWLITAVFAFVGYKIAINHQDNLVQMILSLSAWIIFFIWVADKKTTKPLLFKRR